MSTPDSVTIDDFSQLEPGAHALSIYLYSQRIARVERRLATAVRTPEDREAFLDELRHCQTLRKLHVVRLNEQLLEQAEPATAQAA